MNGNVLSDIILNIEAVEAVIGDRIHPMSDPQSVAFPKVTYQLVQTDPGIANEGVYITQYHFQVDVWATTYKVADTLSTSVVNGLQTYNDGDVRIFVTDCFDLDAQRDVGRDKQTIYRKTIRVTVFQ